jgi:RNA polymerase sigma factor (sigma-70 family)
MKGGRHVDLGGARCAAHGQQNEGDGRQDPEGVMDSLNDLGTEALVARVQSGDEAAWAALTDRYTGMLWSVARGMRLSHADAADAVQTTWLRLVESLSGLREPERLGAWLATTVRREALAILRRSLTSRPSGLAAWEDVPSADDPLDAALLRRERDAALWHAFCQLSERCQALLRILSADPPPTYAAVAAALDIPIGSIGPTRQRCLGVLRRVLAPGTDVPVRSS